MEARAVTYIGLLISILAAAAAAVAVGRYWDELDVEVGVELAGGELGVRWPGPGTALSLTGPATWVYRGQLDL